jgi:CBS domain-containing protein
VLTPFRSGLVLIVGIGLALVALFLQAIYYETLLSTKIAAIAGLVLVALGGYGLRDVLGGLLRRRRAELALYTLGVVGLLIAINYLAVRYTQRYDFTEAGLHSLTDKSISVLERLEEPVHVVFFHNHLMQTSIRLYELIASQTEKITVEFHDPSLNPAQARLLGVRFPGTGVLTSSDRRIDVNGELEADIINGILRVSQGASQKACFLDGHGEADPLSKEAHDHLEAEGGGTGHAHGTGVQYVLHETHGFAKAANGLKELNYTIEKISLLKAGAEALDGCQVLIVAGPKTPLLPEEVRILREYMAAGGAGFFMFDPFIEVGLEPLLRDYGVKLENAMVIDPSHHFAADPSSPAVTDYNYHQVTRDLPLTFFPGVRPLSPTTRIAGVAPTPVINSSRASFGETSAVRAERDDETDLPGPLTLMVAVNKRPATDEDVLAITSIDRAEDRVETMEATGESRMVVIGDSDFATNSFFHVLGNGNLFLNVVNYLAAQENLIGIEPHTRELPEINFTNRQMKATFFLAVFLFPLLLGLVGTAVWWRQR